VIPNCIPDPNEYVKADVLHHVWYTSGCSLRACEEDIFQQQVH